MIKRLLTITFALATMIGGMNVKAKNNILEQMKGHYTGIESPVKAIKHGFGETALPLKQAIPSRVKASEDPVASIEKSLSWGFLQGPDGNDWFYSQTFEFNGYYYASTEITIFDSNHIEMGKFSIDVPEGESVNQMQPFSITSKFFDKNESTYEIAIFNHAITPDYAGKFWVDVYSLTGEKTLTYDYESAMFFETMQGFSNYQRMIACRTAEEGKIDINIYRPGGWDSNTPVIEHTFQIEESLINYMDASFINVYDVEGEIYYVISHYEKEYMQPSEDINQEPVVTPDNSFVLKVYNKNYEEVTTLNIPLEGSEDAFYTFAGFGVFSNQDLRKGEFTGDDQLNFIVTRYDYLLSNDNYLYNIDVFNEKGELVKNIGKRASGWLHMGSLMGYEDQVGLINLEEAEGCVEIVNLPSCESQGVLPGVIDGRLISTNIDRCIVGDSYKYVISVSQGMFDEEGNVVSSIGWYNPDFTVDHYSDFTISPYLEYFTAYISPEVLNPYLIDSDSAYEFVFLTKERNQETDTLDNYLYICKEDGTVLRKFTNNDAKGAYYTGGFMNLKKTNPSLYVTYYNDDTYEYAFDFYRLPFEKFATGGDGTAENPYMISSAGDLAQIASEPAAHYMLANDIDVSNLANGWTPIASFSGTLDGQNYAIKGLRIDCSADYVGLFGSLEENAVVKNLVLINPEITLNSNNYFVGVVAGIAIGTTIDNIHLYDVVIKGNNCSGCIGGLFGQTSSYTTITSCSVNDLTIDSPKGVYVGGIVGDVRTSTTVATCYAGTQFGNGSSIKGDTEVGGIVGVMGMDCIVRNCHTDLAIEGETSVGGIVGNNSSRGPVYNNIAEGTIKANSKNAREMSNAGGVIGYLEADWEGKTKGNPVRNNIVLVKSIDAPENALAVGRVIGWTIANATYEENETPLSEIYLLNNFVDPAMNIMGQTIQSDNNASVDGADLDMNNINEELFNTCRYSFGTTVDSPWLEVANDEKFPKLYVEDVLRLFTISVNEVTAIEGESFTLNVESYGYNAEEIEFKLSDETVVNIAEVTYPEGSNSRKAIAVIDVLSEGNATITVVNGDKELVCTVIGLSGVEKVTELSSAIFYDGTTISAPNAKEISIYSISGVCIATISGDNLYVGNLESGVYVAIVTTTEGKTDTIKLIVK